MQQAQRLIAEPAILGAMAFWQGPPLDINALLPFVTVPLRPLAGNPLESWPALGPVEAGRNGRVISATDGAMMFGMVLVGKEDIETATHQAYIGLFDAVDGSATPHVIRIWNYVPHITGIENGAERYRRFNAGRQQAFHDRRAGVVAPPAACALGSMAGHQVLFFLAAAHPGIAIENPRQISAYRYPEQYGKHRPAFSRAMLCGSTLYVSGTASIVGHETLHAGNIESQTHETVTNLQAVLSESERHGFTRPANGRLNAYLRYPDQLPTIQRIVSQAFPDCEIAFAHAEICRPDLLIEIEACFGK
jgi:enamine deaminase RidA (YjgF/YER057c/UK114 family)